MESTLVLLQSFDSLFPIGAFTLSNGMETYVQKEIVKDKNSLQEYLDTFIYLMPFNDLGMASFVMQTKNFVLADSVCAASKSPVELRQGSNKLCARFIKAQKEINRSSLDSLLQYEKLISENKCHGMFPVALGLYFADLKLDIKDALRFYAYSQISTLVNHAVKLVPLGQMEGQKALFYGMQKIDDAVNRAINIKEEELGSGGPGFDFRSMEHEKLYSRLYIS
ncbi:MAG: hypothetical protein MJ169_07465 [Treponema sp.]|nr:hypothetical protein [Treponema sp.]